MFEHFTEPLISHRRFYRRLLNNLFWALFFIFLSLGLGMMGYHHYEGMDWVDAYANASMILSGMGPLTPLNTVDGKIFAGSYALYSGLAFIFSVGLIFAPLIHRFLHQFHLEEAEMDNKPVKKARPSSTQKK